VKYLTTIFFAVAIIFIIKISLQSMYSSVNYSKEANRIKSYIELNLSREEVYDILKKQEIIYHNDKNRNIDITGAGITIEFSSSERVIDIATY